MLAQTWCAGRSPQCCARSGASNRLVAGTGPSPRLPQGPVDLLWQRIVSGPVDVDRLDFLRRDALFANVPYGIIDVQRILASLRVWGPPDDPALYLDEKGIGPLQSLIFGRFLMYGNVYWHHTGRIITRMIVRAVEDAFAQGLLAPEQLVEFDDATLLERLRSAPQESQAYTLLLRIEQRDLYKRAVELRPTDLLFDDLMQAGGRQGGRLQAEEVIQTWAMHTTGRNIPSDALWLDLPRSRTFRPIDGVICRVPPPGHRNPVPWEAVSGLTTGDLDRLARSVQRVRILATDRELAGAINAAWQQDRQGIQSALRAIAV